MWCDSAEGIFAEHGEPTGIGVSSFAVAESETRSMGASRDSGREGVEEWLTELAVVRNVSPTCRRMLRCRRCCFVS